MNCLISQLDLQIYSVEFCILTGVSNHSFFSERVFSSTKYSSLSLWSCKLKENYHLDVSGHTKNLMTSQTLVREALIFISTKNQVWETFFLFKKKGQKPSIVQVLKIIFRLLLYPTLNDLITICMLITPLGLTFYDPMEFFRQEYWSGLPFPPSGDLPNPGIELVPPMQANSLPLSHCGSPFKSPYKRSKLYQPFHLSWDIKCS